MVSNNNDLTIVWVFMSEFSAEGQLGAPAGVFHTKDEADAWINHEQINGILYEFPVGVALVDYAEPLNGHKPFITKHCDQNSKRYRAGNNYLGYLPHHHYSF